jgi:hypothetical protein
VTIVQILAIDGRLVFAFPSERTPFVLDREEVGGGYPDKFYGVPRTGTTIGLSAEAFLRVPAAGEVKLANAYVLYEYPGYIAFGGGVGTTFLDAISLSGGVDGELNFSNGRYRFGGSVRACVIDIDVCAGAVAVVSNRGLGGCLELGPLHVGGGLIYDPFQIKIWLLDGCRWSVFDEKNVRGRAAQAQLGAPYEVAFKKGDRSRMIEVQGTTGAPRLTVTAPDGTVLETPPGIGLVSKGTVRVARSERSKLVSIGLQNPAAGTYRIEQLPLSPSVTKIEEAVDPPAAKAKVSIGGTAAKRVLSYDVSNRPAQRVTFTEVQADGNMRQIGTITGGGKGTLRFSPAPSKGTNRIVAQFELDGIPAETVTVARFVPPAVALARPAKLKIVRRGTTLRVTWKAVPGATGYEVTGAPTGGASTLVRAKRAAATLKRVSRASSGKVTVRAVAALRTGPAARAGYRATAKRKTRFGKLAKCSGTTRITCTV